MSALAAGLIAGGSAIASLIGTAASNSANTNLNRENRAWQEKMWNKTNEYNLPINIMQRYRDAGLNPNLIYGNLNQASANMPSSPDTQGALDYGQAFRGLGNQIFDNILAEEQTEANVKVAETQANLNTTNQKKAEEEATNIIADTAHKQLDNIFLSKTMQNRIDSEVQKLELLKKNNLISEAQYNQELEKIKIFQEQVREAAANADKAEEEVRTQGAITANVEADTLLKDAQKMEAYSSAALNRAKIATEKMQQKFLASGAAANYAQAEYVKKLGDKVEAETSKLKWDEKQVIVNILKDSKTIKYIQSQTSLNYVQAQKLCIDTQEAILNGNWKRLRENVSQHYGTGSLATVLNVVYEAGYNFGLAGNVNSRRTNNNSLNNTGTR